MRWPEIPFRNQKLGHSTPSRGAHTGREKFATGPLRGRREATGGANPFQIVLHGHFARLRGHWAILLGTGAARDPGQGRGQEVLTSTGQPQRRCEDRRRVSRPLLLQQTAPARQTWLGDQRSGRLRSANTSFWRARRIIAMTGVGRRLSREAFDAGGDPVNCAAARGRRNCGQRPCAPPVPGSGVRPAEYPNHTALCRSGAVAGSARPRPRPG